MVRIEGTAHEESGQRMGGAAKSVLVEGGADSTKAKWKRERWRRKKIVNRSAVDAERMAYPLALEAVKGALARMGWE